MYSMMPSAKVDAYIKKDVRALLWAGHPEFDPQEGGTSTPSAPPFMKKEAAQLKWGDGGVGVLNWDLHTKAIRAHWIVRYLDPTHKENGSWCWTIGF